MTRNIRYWIEYWSSLFSGIEYRRFALTLINPRVLLRELIDEVETRSLRNADNRQFLFDQINLYFENDPPTRKCLTPVLTLVRREFSKQRFDIMVQLCRRGIQLMDTLEYYDAAVDALTEALMAETPVTRKSLGMICQDLVVELLEVGYSQKFTESIPKDLFSEVHEHDGTISTQFPHDIPYPKIDASLEEKETFRRDLVTFMTGLSDRTRLEALKKYPRFPRQRLSYIFQVRGIRGAGAFDIGPVHFYSPVGEKVIKDSRGIAFDNNPELFGSGEHVYLNAVVQTDTLDPHSGAAKARRQIINAVNCLRFALTSRAPYEIGGDYVVVSADGHMSAMSFTRDRRSGLIHWHDSLEVTDDLLRIIEESDVLQQAAVRMLSEADGDLVQRKLLDSVHWFRKGEEAEAPEDQLLWYWISMENLFNPSLSHGPRRLLREKGDEGAASIALDLLPRLRCLGNAYERGWMVFEEIRLMLASPFLGETLTLPAELIQRAGLKEPTRRVYLQDFVEAIPDILKHVPDGVVREHLEETQVFYADSSNAAGTMEKELTMFRGDAVMLYRTRNKIVHSASVGDTTLPYYVRSAGEFARKLILGALQQFYLRGNRSFEGIISALFSEYDLLLENIKRFGPGAALFGRKEGR